MTFKRILSVLIGTFIAILTIYVLQGACFRLVDHYANKRLQWAWGSYLQGSPHPVLSKLPLDHFAEAPAFINQEDSLGQFKKEDQYSQKIMSYTRPRRDNYMEFLGAKEDPLRNFEIRDLQVVRGAVLPGLSRPAMYDDVKDGLARREGDSLEYAEALLIFLTSANKNSEYEQEFASLEGTFAFFLNHGIACVLLEAEKLEDLMGKVSFLKATYPLVSSNIIVYGKRQQASLILEACFARPSSYAGVIIESPSRPVPPPTEGSKTWFLGIQNEKDLSNEAVNRSLIQWATKLRQSDYLYPSKMGGLLRIKKENHDIPLNSFAAGYILQCKEYFRVASLLFHPPQATNKTSQHYPTKLKDDRSPKLDLSNNVLIKQNASIALEEDNEFICPIITEYRKINQGDAVISKMNNRELVLKIGKSFEEMGPKIMQQIKEKDPDFVRYYLSLKELL